MKLKKLKDVKDGEILGKEILTDDYQILLAKGTIIKKEYIQKLYDIGIKEVYVEEKGIPEQEINILKEEIEDGIKDQVKDILEHHTYQHNEELKALSDTADHIIGSIIEEEEVVERVYDIKNRSKNIYEHSLNICTIAILTALRLDMPEEKIHDIGVGCLLHDIGLRYLPQDFQYKKLEEMNDQEISEYKKHPVYGYSILQGENWIHDISKNIILYHHERLDATGYPLKATEIPFEAQIVNVCDAFDELICGINCEQMKVYEAIEYLKAFKNVKFNGTIVDAFLEFVAVYPSGSHIVTNEGEEGVVLHQNKEFPNRPVIQIIKDQNGVNLSSPVVIDLVKVNHIFIEKQID